MEISIGCDGCDWQSRKTTLEKAIDEAETHVRQVHREPIHLEHPLFAGLKLPGCKE